MHRLHCPPAAWHVFARGCRRLELFQDDDDYARFLRLLSYSLQASGCTLWAFALMQNHYHLVLYGSSDQLTSCMRRLGCMYSLYHNKRYGLSGHAFDGPYQAYRQRTLLLTLWTVAYVFFNPVKGGLCSRPEDYPWSGYRCYLGEPGSPLSIDVDFLMLQIHPEPRQAWALFHEALRLEARRQPKPVFGRLTMVEVHVQQFERLRDYAREHADRLRGEDPDAVAMAWARQTGISPRAIARAMGLGSTREVSDVLYAFKKRLKQDPGLREVLSPP